MSSNLPEWIQVDVEKSDMPISLNCVDLSSWIASLYVVEVENKIIIKKKYTKPTEMQICIIWLQPREGWCNISVTEHSRNNIFRLISVSKRNSSLITFVKICFKHLHFKIYLFILSKPSGLIFC